MWTLTHAGCVISKCNSTTHILHTMHNINKVPNITFVKKAGPAMFFTRTTVLP